MPQMTTKLASSVDGSVSFQFPYPIFLVAASDKKTKRMPLRKLPPEKCDPADGETDISRQKWIEPDLTDRCLS